MYIEKIKIDKFRVLEDIEIHFQPPGGATADPETGNVINVIAGVNGCGKTSLLEAIYDCGAGASQGQKSALWGGEQTINRCILYAKTQVPLRYEKSDDQQLQDMTPLEVYQKARGASFSKRLSSNGILLDVEEWIKIFVVEQERRVFDADPKKRTAFAIKEFSKIFEGLTINSKLVDLDNAFNRNRPLFENALGHVVGINQLSDGEKQLYGCIIRLIIENPEDAIILIDEPEIALHPAWQRKIMQIYSRIGKNNQFIVATHSPQIIANTPYQNLIILEKKDDKIVRRHLDRPPIGADVNSILGDFMGVAGEFPEKVVELHRQYREKVEQGIENSADAEKIRLDLLNYETNDSRFMQEMRMLQRLRGRK